MQSNDVPFDKELASAVVTAIMQRQGKKAGADEIKFLCPAHDDHRPSASYNWRKTVWNCQVCGAEGGLKDLAERLGVKVMERKEKAPAKQRHIVAAYDYTNADGKVIYQVVRWEPKDFQQRRPDDNGGWIWNMNGVVHLPYRLPNVVFSDEQETVYVVEGEKDVDNLVKAGLVATSNHGGAGKWGDELSPYLKGRHVVLLPDNDEAGRNHMVKAGRSLIKAGAASIKWLDLPGLATKGDVSDWLAVGNSAEELRTLTEQAEPWQPPADLLDNLTAEPQPSMERCGLGYAFTFPTQRINIVVDHLTHTAGELRGEVLITGTIPLVPSHLHWGTLNMASTTSRKGLATYLAKRTEGTGLDWPSIIEEVSYKVAMQDREGEPFTELGGLLCDPRGNWCIQNFAPLNQPTTVFGQGGSGKSRFVTALLLGVETGQEIVPGFKPCVQGRTLYLDWETDGVEIQERIQMLCKGVGIDPCYPVYRHCKGSFVHQVEEVLRAVQQHNIQLVVVDSVEAASSASRDYAGDANDAVIRLHQGLRLLNVTAILIDHVNKAALSDSKAPRNPYGSIFKMNYARMAWDLRSNIDDNNRISLVLYNIKRNNGGLPFKPVGLTVEFVEGNFTRYNRSGSLDLSQMANLDGMGKIMWALKQGPLTPVEISVATGMSESTVKARLSEGKNKRNLFTNTERGRWGLTETRYEASDGDPY